MNVGRGNESVTMVNFRCGVCRKRHPRGVAPNLAQAFYGVPDEGWTLQRLDRETYLTQMRRHGFSDDRINAEADWMASATGRSRRDVLTEKFRAQHGRDERTGVSLQRRTRHAVLECSACANRPRLRLTRLYGMAENAAAKGEDTVYLY